jgi:IS5 family transposase
MYHKTTPDQLDFIDFYLPFGGKMDKNNRWVKLAKIIPWETVEKHYREQLADTGMGAPAKSGRIAFGALVIKEKLGCTDEETVEQIKENHYLQYFLGLHEYRKEALFDPSMMVHFRCRFKQDAFTAINDEFIAGIAPASEVPDEKTENPGQEAGAEEPTEAPAKTNEGKLIIDATCTPADITYPTDMKLLNEAREKTEKTIDQLHAPLKGTRKKPRTYRKQARKHYINFTKAKKPGAEKIRKAIEAQLNYLKRNLSHIDTLLSCGSKLSTLRAYDYKCLLVIHTLYAQQREMYEKKEQRVADRIVSISQPHVRPIVRGKAGKKVEFGAKLSASCVKGFIYLDRLSWDAFNEGGDLAMQAEAFHTRHGHYPASIHADKIYRTRANRAYCKEKGIRLSGPALGRPRKQTPENKAELQALKEQAYNDELDRIPIEGKFGNCKRKGTLARVMAKLSRTSESVISVGLIVLNLDKVLRELLSRLYLWLLPRVKDHWTAYHRSAKLFEKVINHVIGSLPRPSGWLREIR